MSLPPLRLDARGVRLPVIPLLVARLLVARLLVSLAMVGMPAAILPAAGQEIADESAPAGEAVGGAGTVATRRWSQQIVLASGETFAGAWVGSVDGEAWQFRSASPRPDGDGPSAGSRVGSPAGSMDPPAQAVRRVSTAQLIRFGAAVAPAAGSGVWLVDGSFLAGRIVELDAERCRLVSGNFDVTIPWTRVRSLLLHAPTTDSILRDQLQAAAEARGADDRVLLIGGEAREGTLQLTETPRYPGRQQAAVELKGPSAQAAKIPFREIRSIIPAPLLREPVSAETTDRTRPAGNAAGRVWVGLRDGSRLNVRTLELLRSAAVTRRGETGPAATGQGRATSNQPVSLVCGVELTGRAGRPVADWPAQVVSLAPATPSVACLPQQAPLRYQHQPLFGGAVPLQRWQADDPIDGLTSPAVGGRRYPQGLLMRTSARAVYPVGQAKRLVGAVAAIADPAWQAIPARQLAENLGLRFRVQTADGEGTIRDRWDSGVVRPGQSAQPFDLEIAGAAFVILAVDSATAGDFGDRAVWLDLLATPGTSDQDDR